MFIDEDDGAGTLPAVCRDQEESHRDLRRRGTETCDRGQDYEVFADTGKIDNNLSVLNCLIACTYKIDLIQKNKNILFGIMAAHSDNSRYIYRFPILVMNFKHILCKCRQY